MTSISNTVAKRDNSPAGMIEQYKGDFATMLPSHVNADQWARVAIGAIRRGDDKLKAAAENTGSLMSALATAARLGLEAGTESFYLTPRKVKGRWEILGIPGYQGLIELMYRAGAVSSVVAEVVYESDQFDYQPGIHDRPQHSIDWDAEDRGQLRLVYAYAVMKDGATSKVVVLNRAAIKQIKASSQGASSEYSPWQKHPASMWLKSAVRQLAKWVPTSAEYRKDQIRAVQEVAHEMEQRKAGPTIIQQPTPGDGEYIDEVTGEVFTNKPASPASAPDVHDAELVDDADPWAGQDGAA